MPDEFEEKLAEEVDRITLTWQQVLEESGVDETDAQGQLELYQRFVAVELAALKMTVREAAEAAGVDMIVPNVVVEQVEPTQIKPSEEG